MNNLKNWKTWLSKRGYNSQVTQDGSELIISINDLIIKVSADGLICFEGYAEINNETQLWEILNKLGSLR